MIIFRRGRLTGLPAPSTPQTIWDSASIDATTTVISNGDRTIDYTLKTTNNERFARSLSSKSSGQQYFEVNIDLDTYGTDSAGLGIGDAAMLNNIGAPPYIGSTTDGLGYWNSGNIYRAGSGSASPNGGFPTTGTGKTLCGAVDFGLALVWFRVNNGSWFGSDPLNAGDPVAGTLGQDISYFTGWPVPLFIYCDSENQIPSEFTITLPATPQFPIPTGYTLWT